MIIEYAPISEIEVISPLGSELEAHLIAYKGKVKHASCSAWSLLYKTLCSSDLPIAEVCFSETGKPYFPDSLIHFSISHSHDLCAIAISDHPVGVDIEIVKEPIRH